MPFMSFIERHKYLLMILAFLILITLPFLIPYFATRPLSKEELLNLKP